MKDVTFNVCIYALSKVNVFVCASPRAHIQEATAGVKVAFLFSIILVYLITMKSLRNRFSTIAKSKAF